MTEHIRPAGGPGALGGDRHLAILGAGRAGTALARTAQRAGVPVHIAASRPPAALRVHLAQYAPAATAVPADRIAEGADVVVLMVPQEELDEVDPAWVQNTVLVDATNRWEREPLPEWLQDGLDAGLSSSQVLARHFTGARVVKALNHLSHWDLEQAARAAHHGRRALAVAADDLPARRRVAGLVESLGYEPVELDSLAAGRVLEPGGPVFHRAWTAEGLTRAVGDAD